MQARQQLECYLPQEWESRAALRGNRDKSLWTGSSTVGRGLAGICLAEAEGTGTGALTVLERAAVLLHPLPSEGSLQGQEESLLWLPHF